MTELEKTSVHEGGHGTAAWFCTGVFQVQEITIEPRKPDLLGYVSHSAYRHLEYAEWCKMVIALAGMAAETLVFGSVRSGPSTRDLTSALEAARRVSGDPPWEIPEGKTLPFRMMFRGRISELEARKLDYAYRMAFHVLRTHEVRFYKLVSLLLAQRTMKETDIERALGSRSFVKLMGRVSDKALFFLPPGGGLSPAEKTAWQKVWDLLNADVSVLWKKLVSSL